MAKGKRRPVGKGITKPTMQKMKAQGTYNLQVFSISKDSWRAFRNSDAGKLRSNQLAAINRAIASRYADLAAGKANTMSKKEAEGQGKAIAESLALVAAK
jgi:hypothetical protein